MWQTTSTFGDTLCDWAGPSIHDLDDDGIPEIIFYGNVYDGANGAALDETLGASISARSTGYIPVVADIDGDGHAELVTGVRSTPGTAPTKKWMTKQAIGGSERTHRGRRLRHVPGERRGRQRPRSTASPRSR